MARREPAEEFDATLLRRQHIGRSYALSASADISRKIIDGGVDVTSIRRTSNEGARLCRDARDVDDGGMNAAIGGGRSHEGRCGAHARRAADAPPGAGLLSL
jgi:hypothetical protein